MRIFFFLLHVEVVSVVINLKVKITFCTAVKISFIY